MVPGIYHHVYYRQSQDFDAPKYPDFNGRWRQWLWQGSVTVCGLAIMNIVLFEILFARFLETASVSAQEFDNRRPIFNIKSGQFTTLHRKISPEDLNAISSGAEQFSLNFLTAISDIHASQPPQNYMISPFAVWSLLLMLTEGANNSTLDELQRTLAIGTNQNVPKLKKVLLLFRVNTSTIKAGNFQRILNDVNKPVQRDFENTIEQDYNAQLISVDFQDVNRTFVMINEEISRATNGLLTHIVSPQDFRDPRLIMISSLYFKGQWLYQFDPQKTHEAPFYDEFGNVLGNVMMMTNTENFVYVNIPQLDAFVLELPYGRENRLSMWVILPKRGIRLNKVVHNLNRLGIRSILQQLQNATQYFDGEDVEVYLPSFTTSSHFGLRPILKRMGINQIFEACCANLEKIAQNIYVSSIIHSTRIIVNEEGTEAAGSVQAMLTNKSTPPVFYVNRPFLYIIIEKTTKLLLFAGEVKSNQMN